MADELTIQREIKQSVINAGGFALKLTNRFTIGVPDLAIWLPSFVPAVVEVKDLGECVERFDRQLDVSPKQRDTLRRINATYGIDINGTPSTASISCLIVHIRHNGLRKLVILPPGATRLAHAQVDQLYPSVVRVPTGRWGITSLFKSHGISRL